jgi:lysophospholipase L1-like esterase
LNRRYLVIALGAALLAAVVFVVVRDRGVAPPPHLPLPESMAAIGDSITQAVAVNEEALGGAAEHSWATGNDPNDEIASHYERLVAARPQITGHVFNNSIPGAKMADALAQAEVTVSQDPDYVVFLMGGNDVCTANAASMTSPTDFESQFRAALDRLTSGLPDSAIYVASIPDLHHLWEVESGNIVASTIWANVGVCQAVLSDNEDDREQAQDRNVEFNEILERVCSAYPQCRFDAYAVYDYKFSSDEVGPLDHFHPSEQGQASLADVTWENGYWPEI